MRWPFEMNEVQRLKMGCACALSWPLHYGLEIPQVVDRGIGFRIYIYIYIYMYVYLCIDMCIYTYRLTAGILNN
jgi:hypothetical protein